MGDRPYSGRLADPEFRHQRAVKAATARTTLEAHIRSIVDRAPDLTPEQRQRLASLLQRGQSRLIFGKAEDGAA